MRPSEALAEQGETTGKIVEAHHAKQARVFGSVLRGQDAESGYLDVLIDPKPDTKLFDIGAIRCELTARLSEPVDVLLTPNAFPETFRSTVIPQAIPI